MSMLPASARSEPTSIGHARRIVLDCSTILDYAGRPAVGIVRTEREIARRLLDRANAVFALYDRRAREFRTLSPRALERILADHALGERQIAEIFDAQCALPVRFEPTDIVVEAGLPWGIDTVETLAIRKRTVPFTFCQIVYDIVPLLMPELAVPGIDGPFYGFITDVSYAADRVYCISEATRRDLGDLLGRTGLRVPELRRIELGCDIPAPAAAASAAIPAGEFVTCVGSIEPRKNHRMIVDVWNELDRRRGGDLPTLLIVGAPQWGSEEILGYIRRTRVFRKGKIRLLPKVPDADLAALYDRALFTVYPSFYEGWGLPVAESLARGTPVVTSTGGSLPEVSSGLAETLPPRDFEAWVVTIGRHLDDRGGLARWAAAIRASYRPKPWSKAVDEFLDTLGRA